MKRLIGVFVFLVVCKSSFGQAHVKDSVLFAPLIGPCYSFQVPGADMAKRFGNNHNIGAAFWIKDKKNWMYGFDWCYMFGDQLKEGGILDSIKTPQKTIIGTNGDLSNVRLYERGFNSTFKFGRLFNTRFDPNKNSGIVFMGGLGLLYHKIKIEDILHNAPQIDDPYKKGYDRLTYGLAASEFIGYLFLGSKRYFNFFAGVEFIQGFTKNRRGYNYDTRMPDHKARLDLLCGPKIGIFIPLYKRMPNDFYNY